MVKTYYYMRLDKDKKNDKRSLNKQNKALESYAKNNNIKFNDDFIFIDYCSGENFNREAWNELKNLLTSGDVIVFKDIVVFTENIEKGFAEYNSLVNSEINLIFLDNPTVSTGYVKNLLEIAKEQHLIDRASLTGTVKLLLIAELDRLVKKKEVAANKIKAGIQSSTKSQGRKKGQLDKMNADLREDIIKFINGSNVKQIDLIKKHNLSRNTFKKYVKLISEELVGKEKPEVNETIVKIIEEPVELITEEKSEDNKTIVKMIEETVTNKKDEINETVVKMTEQQEESVELTFEEITEKIINAAKEGKDLFKIQSDKEFYYVFGQIAKYIEQQNKKLRVDTMPTYLSRKNHAQLMERLGVNKKKYMGIKPGNSIFNIIYASLVAYEPKEGIRKHRENLLLGSLTNSNVIYTKIKK